jgi:16S rRNA G966 N2-methylase RsmD
LLEASRQRLAATALNITRADALAWMSRCGPARYDLVLLDPPFSAGLLERALALAVPLVAPGGFLYVESGDAVSEAPPGLEAWRALQAGAVHAQLFKRPGPVLPQPASP